MASAGLRYVHDAIFASHMLESMQRHQQQQQQRQQEQLSQFGRLLPSSTGLYVLPRTGGYPAASVRLPVPENEIERCTVCLCEFETGEEVRNLRCTHIFHVNCIDKWLVYNKKCPVCRLDQLVLQRSDGRLPSLQLYNLSSLWCLYS
ncbi:unnamed protein product [Haemonchus placei]|uniref:RING-type domain-containing protein n=1 Tax=Haemonchus placei TaxID=6290 RepID=A0A0N4W807_HAEPC|nr:unnamed protein product [Haemonchus placei]